MSIIEKLTEGVVRRDVQKEGSYPRQMGKNWSS
jgi:hypothetical protein